MSLVPWRERHAPQSSRTELENWFGRFPIEEPEWHLPAVFGRKAFPPVNVSESEKAWTVTFELPGLDEKDIHVQLMGRQLVVSGERRFAQDSKGGDEKKGQEYRRVESQYGAFERAIVLPENLKLDPDAVSATYQRGMLAVTLPKVEPTPATKIPVRGG